MRGIGVIILLLLAARAEAAHIDIKPLDNGSALIVIDGKFEVADIETFRAKVAALPAGKATVAFQSKGGRLLAGIRIGTLIRTKRFTTVVPDGAVCSSACALAWLGGTQRYVGKDANVGFHAAFTFRAGEPTESGVGNAILGAYLNQLGLSEKAILYITRAAPTSMEWMSLEQAAEHGITVARLQPPSSAPPSSANGAASAEYPDSSPERRALDFVLALAARWSGPNAEVLHALDALYTDNVVYQGKSTPRETVVLSKRRFAERWTERSYDIHPRSLSATCAEAGGTCRVKGRMKWKFRNASTSSRGVATFEYGLVLDGEAPRIAAEASSPHKKQSPTSNPLKQVGRSLQQLLAQISKPRPTNTPVKTANRPKAWVAR